jgi:hypothetical protein
MKFDPPQFEMSESGRAFQQALAAQFARFYEAIDRLTAERDEARRMYCGRVSRDVPLDAFDIAKNHGWDCFPQEDGK